MLQTGLTFGSDGPLIQGTWINPTTGDSFTVRDSFFEDNNYVITTTDGRYIRYEQFQNYVQADEKSVNEIKNSIKEKSAAKEEAIPAEISSLIDNDTTTADALITIEDYELIYGNKTKSTTLGNLNDKSQHVAPTYEHARPTVAIALPENMNTAIIKKALNNTEQPKFKVDVDWNNFPSKQIEMLYDIMGISEDEIIEWYLDNIQLIDIIETIKKSIKERICSTETTAETIVCKIPEIKTTVCTDVVEDQTEAVVKVVKPKKKTTKSKK